MKLPLLLLLLNAGFQSGLSVVFVKLSGELIVSGDASDYIFMLIVLIACTAVSSVSTIHSLNLGMKHFDQLEVMPIYMVSLMLMWMVAGLVIL